MVAGLVVVFAAAGLQVVVDGQASAAVMVRSVERLNFSFNWPGPEINDAGYISFDADLRPGAPGTDVGVRAPNGTVTLVPSLGGAFTWSTGINNANQVVGYSSTAGDGSQQAFIWDSVNGIRNLQPTGALTSAAWAVNDHGDVAGIRTVVSASEAVVWKADGTEVVLEPLPGFSAHTVGVYDINDQGHVLGYNGGGFNRVPVVWDETGQPTPFSTLNGEYPSLFRMNDNGMVAGKNASESGLVVGNLADGLTDTGLATGNAPRLNNRGQVLTNVFRDNAWRTGLWDAENGFVELPEPAGTQNGVLPVALNDTGLVLGLDSNTDDGVLWTLDSDDDDDGIGASVENGAPNAGDGNNDGIADADQPEVTSLPAGSGTAPYVTIVGPSGSSFVAVEMQPLPLTPPPGVGLPLGLLAFELHDVPVGGAVPVEYHMPAGAGITEFWQWDGTTWADFAWDGATGAQITGDVATLTYQDGGRGDRDGIANGIIVDPIAAASPLSMSIGDTAVVEGNTGKARTLTFAVTLSEPASTLVTVGYRIEATGSATTPADFDNKKGKTYPLKFVPSLVTGKTATVKYVSVKVAPDTEAEGDESFAVTLSNPTGGYGLGDATGTATILDDDPRPGLHVSIGNTAIYEGDAGLNAKKTNNGKMLVSLSSPATSTVSVTVSVAGDSAGVGNDFKAVKTKVLTFAPGQWQKPVVIPVYPDTTAEPDETVLVTLSSPSSGVDLFRAVGTATILSDD